MTTSAGRPLPGRGEAGRPEDPSECPSSVNSADRQGLICHAIPVEGTPSMDPGHAAERTQSAPPESGQPGELEAIDFVRFCYRRRRVGWPELYDEMCAVAGRGLYRGFCSDDLSHIGIGFTLYEMPGLATLVHRVVAEDVERRRVTTHGIRAAFVAEAMVGEAIISSPDPVEPESVETVVRLVAVPAGA
jgi:hypothetical protein